MTSQELAALRMGGETALAAQFSQYQDPLKRMLEFRLDNRLRGRVDPEDILQEAWIEVARRLDEYLARPDVSVFVWIRQLTYQVLIAVQRRHFGQKRDPRQELAIPRSVVGDVTGHSMAAAFCAQLTSPSQTLAREEEFERLQSILSAMDETDREVLALRHFEQLGNNQVAEVLGLSATAASNRYVRALARLSDVMSRLTEDPSR